MSTAVYLAHSHSWLRNQFMAHGWPDLPGVSPVERRQDADMIVYLNPPWADVDAADSLRDFSPRELLRTYVYSQAPEPFAWAPGVYLNVPAGRACTAYEGGFYVAHHHHEQGGLAPDLDAARDLKHELLWSFVGTLSNHPVRLGLKRLDDERGFLRDTQAWSDRVRWGWSDQYSAEGRQAFSDFAKMLGRSAFVLCPRGRGPSSIRLFEALQVGRCPVIISDDWLPPSFVDWDSCSIRVSESQVTALPSILREREAEAEALGRQARAVWERLFAPKHRLETLIRSCLQITARRPRRSMVLVRASLYPDTLRQSFRRAKGRL